MISKNTKFLEQVSGTSSFWKSPLEEHQGRNQCIVVTLFLNHCKWAEQSCLTHYRSVFLGKFINLQAVHKVEMEALGFSHTEFLGCHRFLAIVPCNYWD